MNIQKIPHDIIGTIAIIKFQRTVKQKQKLAYAKQFLKNNQAIKTVVEKTEKFRGRLRTQDTKYLAGEKTRITLHKENGCIFKLDINETYFSPRLSNQRKIISEELAKKVTRTKNKVIVMFAGVAPYPIAIANKIKEKNRLIKAEIISNELNRKANIFAEQNIKLNHFENYVHVVPGDSNKLPEKMKGFKADFIIMPRPNLKDTFLKATLKLSKKGTLIYYHGFGEKQQVIDEIKRDTNNKIGKISIEKAGEIAPYKFRWLAKFVVK